MPKKAQPNGRAAATEKLSVSECLRKPSNSQTDILIVLIWQGPAPERRTSRHTPTCNDHVSLTRPLRGAVYVLTWTYVHCDWACGYSWILISIVEWFTE